MLCSPAATADPIGRRQESPVAPLRDGRPLPETACPSCRPACSNPCRTRSRRCCPSTSTPTRWAVTTRASPTGPVFEHVIAALVHGSGYERIASPAARTAPSDATSTTGATVHCPKDPRARPGNPRPRDRPGAGRTVRGRLHYQGLCGGEAAGRSPVTRDKKGLKRSVATEARGVPLGIVAAGANRHDSPLLVPTLQAAKEQVGELPRPVNANLHRATTVTRHVPPWLSLASPARLPARVSPPRSRPASAGWRTRSRVVNGSASCGAAPRSAAASWTSTSTYPPRSSRAYADAARPRSTTGTTAQRPST